MNRDRILWWAVPGAGIALLTAALLGHGSGPAQAGPEKRRVQPAKPAPQVAPTERGLQITGVQQDPCTIRQVYRDYLDALAAEDRVLQDVYYALLIGQWESALKCAQEALPEARTPDERRQVETSIRYLSAPRVVRDCSIR